MIKPVNVILETNALFWVRDCGVIGGDVGGGDDDDAGNYNPPSPSYSEHQNCNNRCLTLRCHRP